MYGGVGSKILGVGLADPLYLPASSYQYLQPVEQIGYNIRKSFWRSPPNTASETPGQAPSAVGTKVPRALPVLTVSPLLSDPLTSLGQSRGTLLSTQRPPQAALSSSACSILPPASKATQRPIDAPQILNSSSSLDSSFQTTISDKRPTTNAPLAGTSCSSS